MSYIAVIRKRIVSSELLIPEKYIVAIYETTDKINYMLFAKIPEESCNEHYNGLANLYQSFVDRCDGYSYELNYLRENETHCIPLYVKIELNSKFHMHQYWFIMKPRRRSFEYVICPCFRCRKLIDEVGAETLINMLQNIPKLQKVGQNSESKFSVIEV